MANALADFLVAESKRRIAEVESVKQDFKSDLDLDEQEAMRHSMAMFNAAPVKKVWKLIGHWAEAGNDLDAIEREIVINIETWEAVVSQDRVYPATPSMTLSDQFELAAWKEALRMIARKRGAPVLRLVDA